ncbi:hypothetical protein AYR46_20175 [Sphingobium yanoikuyae]|uniref:hypothetical protein n=1 Tax=Sphingobium yanoikuyae TaxID=13690 RepID=UPI0007A74B58|nr:hypothetical protein [Sphingobium yanoikuyae]KZC75989.1 hypothetical protein AYR46_20175 [Sphingobium yanoikuyae]
MFLAQPLSEQAFSAAPWPIDDAACIGLTDLEESVIVLGGKDPLASILPPPRWPWLVGWFTGAAPVNRLANDRLEALRTLVVALRFPRRISRQRAVADALGAGVGLELVTTLCLRSGAFSQERSNAWG